MSIPFRLPALLADPPPARGRTVLAHARLFDATGDDVREDATVVVDDGRITDVTTGDEVAATEDARIVDLGGRFLLPGLIDCHAHLSMGAEPELPEGAEPLRPGVAGHVVAAILRRALRMGITTIRDVGAYGDTVLEVRQAMRYGAFRGPRLLVSGRLVGASSPQGRKFPGMYREADGPDELRKAAREQLRAGADFVKIMMTGARSVEWENPGPAQLTPDEVTAVVDEVHRQGYRVAAHCEGLDGTRLAIEAGVDTIEHGLYLHQAPELLDQLAARRGVLIPTLSFLLDVAERQADRWSPHLVERGTYNLAEAYRTVAAAVAAGVPIAMGFDSGPEERAAAELGLLVDAGLTPAQALRAATSTAAWALGLDDLVGTVEPGRIADLLVVDGDPLTDIGVLVDPDRIHLVVQQGELVAGRAVAPDGWPPAAM